tara:strand:+ start:375 stop:650 length:276 start_codon:yes stop_codon:yes gene_type:complete
LKKPSRVLNERNLFFFLTTEDIIFLSSFLLVFEFFNLSDKAGYFGLGIAFAMMLILIPIRITQRDKIIADFLTYYLMPRVRNVSRIKIILE